LSDIFLHPRRRIFTREAAQWRLFMTIKLRVFVILTVALATMWMAGCGHYTCGLTFGSSTCGSSSATGLSSSTGSGTASAFVYAIDTAGTIDSYTLNNTAVTFAATPSYTAPTVPASDGGKGMVVPLNQQAMITNPAGSLLFIAVASPSEIYVYQIGSDGSLTPASGSPFSTGALQPGGLATDGLGKYLYVTQDFSDNTGEEIGAYSIGSSGTLTLVPGSPFAFPMGQVQGEPTGKYLIGTTGNAQAVSGTDLDQLYVFAIGTTGALTQVSTTTTVNSPFRIAVQPNSSGNLVYSFGLNDTATAFNPPEGYQISSTGTLTAVTGSPFTDGAIGDWGQFDQSGANLFLFGSVVAEGTDTVTDNIGALAVGSGGTLTEPTTGITLVTQGYWTVTDPKQ
jgi:hypothetical protein